MVRKRAFAALAQIKTATAQPPVGERLHVAGRVLGGDSIKGLKHVMVSVAGEDMREAPKVTPLQFILSESSQYITSFKVTEKTATRVHERGIRHPAIAGGGGRRLLRRLVELSSMEAAQRSVEHSALHRDRGRRTAGPP
jgi:hypothetical protein